jgi:hypothetical protein
VISKERNKERWPSIDVAYSQLSEDRRTLLPTFGIRSVSILTVDWYFSILKEEKLFQKSNEMPQGLGKRGA